MRYLLYNEAAYEMSMDENSPLQQIFNDDSDGGNICDVT